MKQKFKNLLKDLKYIDNIDDTNIAQNLLKRPIKDKIINTPHTTVNKINFIYQIDTLFLPQDTTVIDKTREKAEFIKVNQLRVKNNQQPLKKDKGYSYLLVVVDLSTNKVDAEPFKYKYSFIVRDCLKRIFKRKILKQPEILEVDAGKEFMSDFKDYFEKLLTIRTKIVGRHRQQAVVEGMNSIISKIIQTRQLSEELINKEVSREWVLDIPEIVKTINKYYSHSPPTFDEKTAVGIRCQGKSCDILMNGTLVRYQLDNPIDAVNSDKLHGKFRIGDIRWSKDVNTITQIYLKPNQPPMYQLNNNSNVAYTRNQLQVVNKDEKMPPKSVLRKLIIDKILDKVKIKNLVNYVVQWNDGTTSNETRKNLLIQVPELVKEFENSKK